MSTLIQSRELSYSVGNRSLFQHLDLTINAQEKIGLVGYNGTGKSTLLALLSGELSPDAGEVIRRRNMVVATVEQFLPKPLHELNLLSATLDKLPLAARETEAYRAEMALINLNFSPDEFTTPVAGLSGGQQNRLMIARAIISEPDLILFDEPTNHLDLTNLLLLEKFLQTGYQGAFLMVSHDREMLDKVTNKTLFLRDQRIYSFGLPYTQAREKLVEHDAAAAQRRESEERKIESLRQSAKRLETWGKVYDNEKLSRKAKSMEKRIERLDQEKTFVTRGHTMQLDLDTEELRAKRVLHIENKDIVIADKVLVHIEDLYVQPGERIVLLGANGCGKTQTLKTLNHAFHLPETGIRFNPNCQLGYYDQNLADLNPQDTLFSAVCNACEHPDETVRHTLIAAGFPYQDLDKQISILSGGEKARIMFVIMRLNRPNLLILDEPTNHIDIEGREALEMQILESEATVLMTSHDRCFVDNLATRFWYIHQQRLEEIHDPEPVYQVLIESERQTDAAPHNSASRTANLSSNMPSEEDDLLARLCELEEKLAEDQQRKAKHQKPTLQQAWQEEIKQLKARLGM